MRYWISLLWGCFLITNTTTTAQVNTDSLMSEEAISWWGESVTDYYLNNRSDTNVTVPIKRILKYWYYEDGLEYSNDSSSFLQDFLINDALEMEYYEDSLLQNKLGKYAINRRIHTYDLIIIAPDDFIMYLIRL
jgi:hypothetical protein